MMAGLLVCWCPCLPPSLRNLDYLASTGHRVFAVDLLGQGKSWPKAMPAREHGVVFSVDTWREQLLAFVR